MRGELHNTDLLIACMHFNKISNADVYIINSCRAYQIIRTLEAMTAGSISTYYKWLSLATLALSVLGPMTLTDGTISEKLWIGLLMNGQFHLAYHSLSSLAFGMYQQIQPLSRQRAAARKIFIGISLFMMIGPIPMLIELVRFAINEHKYDQLLVTMTFLAIFLGACSLNLKVKGAAD